MPLILVVFGLLVGVVSSAEADEPSSVASLPSQAPAASPSIPNKKASPWAESLGLDGLPEGFAGDVFNLMTGIDHSLTPSTNLRISAGDQFRLRFSF